MFLSGERVGVRAGDQTMSDGELARMRTRMGMVFQHFALWPDLSVLGNLMAAPMHVQQRPRDEVSRAGGGAAAQSRPLGQTRRAAGAALRRREAASWDRARADDAAGAAVIRRADERSRSGTGRRGFGRDEDPRQRRHDDGGGHSRNGLRARGGDARGLHGPGPRLWKLPNRKPSSRIRRPIARVNSWRATDRKNHASESGTRVRIS